MNNSKNISFNWNNKKLNNLGINNLILKNKILVFHHGPDGNAESSPFWKSIVKSGLDFSTKNDMAITFKGFDGDVSKMITYLDDFNNKKIYKNYDAIVSTVVSSSTYGELNPDYNGELKDVTITSKLNIIGRAIPIFTFNTEAEKVDSAIKYIGNGNIGEENMGKKLAIMAAKYAIDSVNMNTVLKFNSTTLQDEAFVNIVKDVTETLDLDGNGKLERKEIEAYLQPLGVNIDPNTLDLIISTIETQFVNRGIRNITQLNMTPAQIINEISKLSEQQQEVIFKMLNITRANFNIAQSFLPTITDINQQLSTLGGLGITQEVLLQVEKELQSFNQEPPVEETPVEETPVEEIPVEEIPVEEIPVEEIPQNKITQLKSDPNFDIKSLENMTKNNQIFNFFKNYSNNLFDKIIIFPTEKDNSAFNSRINGIKRIFNEDKIKVVYNISDIKKEVELDFDLNYGIFSLQEQHLDEILELIDDLKEDNINILSFGVCDLSEIVENDLKYSFISAASGTKPDEQINNVLYAAKEFINKLKKNNTSFVRNLHNRTSRAISETTTTGISLNNIDTVNGQLISLDSMRESLNLNVVNNGSKELLDYLNKEYSSNISLVNKLFEWIALKNTLNNGQGYTIHIPTEHQCDITYIIDKIVNGYMEVFNVIISNKHLLNDDNIEINEGYNPELIDDEIISNILNSIHKDISYNDFFDMEFIIHDAEKLGFTHSEIDEQNIKDYNGVIDQSKIFTFYHLYNNSSGVNKKDKIKNFLKLSIVSDAISYLNEICKTVAVVRYNVSLGKGRKFNLEDRDSLYNNNIERKKKKRWWQTVKSVWDDGVNIVEDFAERAAKEIEKKLNEALDFIKDKFSNINICKLLAKYYAPNLVNNFAFISNEVMTKLIKKGSEGSCFIFGMSGEVTYINYQEVDIKEIDKGKIIKRFGFKSYTPFFISRKYYFRGSGNTNPTSKLIGNYDQLPPRKFWGPMQHFFNFGITKVSLFAPDVRPYVLVGTEISSENLPIPASTEIGAVFKQGATLTLTHRIKLGGTEHEFSFFKFHLPPGAKTAFNTKGEFRLTLTGDTIKNKKHINLSLTSFIQLLDLGDTDRKNIQEILDKIETKISFDIEYSFEIQPFIACKTPPVQGVGEPPKELTDLLFVGITMPSNKFKTTNIKIEFPDWTNKIPNINQIKVCIKGIIEALQINDLPCFEINTS